ncbi:MAG: hypothetical protein U9O54_00680, partial [Chloroflexota bacterium]|nr:hypothetical protein [Chloroflexota bacterium]
RYIQPVYDNTQRLDNAEIRQAQQQEQLVERIESIRERMETLEMQNDADKEVFAELQAQIDALSGQVYSAQATAQASQGYAEELAADLQKAIATIEAQQAQIQDDVEDLGTEQIPVEALQNELTLVKVMELLTRAQQSLLHSNFGLAQNDLQAAQELLYGLQIEATDAQMAHIDQVIQHLETASDQLPNYPNLASNELEIAWQILVSGEIETDEDVPQATPTPTPAP